MSYAGLDQFKNQVDKVKADDDTNIQLLLDAASDGIDRILGRPIGSFVADSSASARVYVGNGLDYVFIDENVEVASVAVKDTYDATTYTAWASTDWNTAGGSPEFPDWNGLPYTFIQIAPGGDYSRFISGITRRSSGRRLRGYQRRRELPTIEVTAKWGFSVIAPNPIIEANIAQAARWYKRGKGSWAIIIGSGSMGTNRQKGSATAPLDPDIETMIKKTRYYVPAIG